jgi:uncharacterized protein
MDNQDRQAIEDLFVRLSEVERQAPPRDAEAERFIRDRIGRQPSAPYLMAQTIVVQEHALQEAQRRIQELERGGTERQGRGLFSSVPPVPRAKASAPESMSPAQGGRGGFLAGAAQTAMGVAGGLLLGNFIAGMLGGNEAQAADTSPEAEQDAEVDAAGDDGGGFFDGGDGGF